MLIRGTKGSDFTGYNRRKPDNGVHPADLGSDRRFSAIRTGIETALRTRARTSHPAWNYSPAVTRDYELEVASLLTIALGYRLGALAQRAYWRTLDKDPA